MEYILKSWPPGPAQDRTRPTREVAMAAVTTLIRWTRDNPDREGLRDTPRRVVDAYEEFFSGYLEDPVKVLSRTFEEVAGYDDMVMLRDIRLESHCEHHIVPILGFAHIAYMPGKCVVGISKIARALDILARRLQTQETLTAQITVAIETALKPRGTAVYIDAKHQCMTTRGIHKPEVATVTTSFTGIFKSDQKMKAQFLAAVHGNRMNA